MPASLKAENQFNIFVTSVLLFIYFTAQVHFLILFINVKACEAATACISRPTTPLEEVNTQRETETRQVLEDLIDQVRQLSVFHRCVCTMLIMYIH